MSKSKKILAIALSAALCAGAVASLAACGSKEKNVELPAYTGEEVDANGKMLFNHDIFYRNDNKGIGPDPFILDDTQEGRTGYYYAYSTLGYNYVYRSKDLSDWEGVGQAIDVYGNAEYGKAANYDVWAPEVIYDAEARNGEGEYYMFFSASPDKSTTTLRSVMFLGTSDKPYGPFKLVNFLDSESCDGNLHDYDQSKYNEYFAKYLLFDPEDFAAAGADYYYQNFQAVNKQGVGYLRSIDPHPYVDPVADSEGKHKKYLYFCGNGSEGANPLFAMEMENWYTPKWDTFTDVTRYSYYTVEDFYKQRNGEQGIETVPYESNGINEGATVIYNESNQKYYLTYSTGTYENSSYQVAQAVGDTPMGPFRKLTLDENGCFLSGGLQGSQEVSGSGHHGLFTVGDKIYAVYHRHNDFNVGGGERNGAIDEVVWITIKDKDGNDLQVLYSNGPSTTVQPKILDTKYKNIAGAATVSGGSLESGSSLNSLTDGLLSSYATDNAAIEEIVKETYLTSTSTIEFNFADERTVRAIMVYNSKNGSDVFRNIKRIEILSEGTNYVIQNVKFNKAFYTLREFDNKVTYVSPCAAAFAEFDEIKTTRIRITVEVPAGQTRVGLSEVCILGI
ncbi:MAG: family 43 glycosylhydrolase [Muribaculaceae bacterium]|nr:family 43 glycosylhydrolase [Muribaculaceae bacterium]